MIRNLTAENEMLKDKIQEKDGVNEGLAKDNDELLTMADEADAQTAIKVEENKILEDKLKEVNLTNETMQLGLEELTTKQKEALQSEKELQEKLENATTE